MAITVDLKSTQAGRLRRRPAMDRSSGGALMEMIHEDRFVVFVREDCPGTAGPEVCERELVHCATYEEAHWVRQEYGGPHRKCIVRYLGPAGGGD